MTFPLSPGVPRPASWVLRSARRADRQACCPWLRPGAGAVALQNITLPSLGPQVLDLLEQGLAPGEALASVFAGQEHGDYRQVTVIDHLGRTAHFEAARTPWVCMGH